MPDQSWDPMDPNSTPPIRQPGEVWVFVTGHGWIHFSADDVREIESLTDHHIIHGTGNTNDPPKGIFQGEAEKSWVTPPLEPNSVVAKIKADWVAAAAPHLDPLWMVKALGIPPHYCAPAPRYWSARDIFYALGSDAPVVQLRLGDPALVAEELTRELGDTSPVPELRLFVDELPPVPWWTPGEEEDGTPH